MVEKTAIINLEYVFSFLLDNTTLKNTLHLIFLIQSKDID